MTELEKRCVDALAKAQGLDPHEIAALPISTATGNLLDEVRAVLAEAGVAELVEAATYLRDDMLERAKREAWQHNGDIVVDAGAGAWSRFNAALAKIGANQ